MFYKAKVAVYSEIHIKHINAVQPQCKVFAMLNLVLRVVTGGLYKL